MVSSFTSVCDGLTESADSDSNCNKKVASYSQCCSVSWGREYSNQSQWGVPPSSLHGGLLHPDLPVIPPVETGWGYPPSGLDRGTPEGTWTWHRGNPWKGYGTSGLKYYGMEMGYLPRNVNRQVSVKTVPSPFLRNTGGNDINLHT